MRITFMIFTAAVLLASGCDVNVGHGGHGGGHGHGHHRSRHHWNAAGPAYAEAASITAIVIIASKLPAVIDGEYTPTEEAAWRRDWPLQASQLVADGLTKRMDGGITGSVSDAKPSTGYYMNLQLLRVDVGDRRPNEDGTPRLGTTSLSAHGFIYNATSGELVADVKFTESAGSTDQIQFDKFMSSVGSALGDWFKERRKK